jgi:hypothetical protein
MRRAHQGQRHVFRDGVEAVADDFELEWIDFGAHGTLSSLVRVTAGR